MSGMAGNVSAFATVWTYDVYKPLINKKRQRPPLLEHGPAVLAGGRVYFDRHGLLAVLFLQRPRILPGLGLFFLIPLFAVVILGMTWKRCTSTGAFWGFLVGIVSAVGMYVYVHTFPDGHRPVPQVTLEKDAVVRLREGRCKG